MNRAAIEGSLADILTLDQFEILMASAAPGSSSGLSIVEKHVARPITCGDEDPAKLTIAFDAYGKGCTLLQSGLQTRWPPLGEVCRNIETELISHRVPLAETVGANAYLTPANAQGFDIHYDNHCALILQLHGEKSWTVFSPLEELPITRCERSMPRGELGAPILDTILAEGDVLYIPRGFPHCASSRERGSLHVTLSLRTMTWLEVIQALGLQRRAFRRSVRASAKAASSAQDYFEREIVPQMAGIEVEGFLQQRLLDNVAGLGPIPNGRLRAIDETTAINADTPVARAPLVTCVAHLENSQAILRLPGATLRLPAVMKPVFDFIVENETFTARALPQVNATYDALEFTRILIRRGLVRPQTANPTVLGPVWGAA
jgi:hypothetical protein